MKLINAVVQPIDEEISITPIYPDEKKVVVQYSNHDIFSNPIVVNVMLGFAGRPRPIHSWEYIAVELKQHISLDQVVDFTILMGANGYGGKRGRYLLFWYS